MSKKEEVTVGIAAIVGIIFAIIAFISSVQTVKAGPEQVPSVFYGVGTSTAETVATSNTRILATSTARTWAKISNNSQYPIFCAYRNGNPAALNQGFLINASSTYEMDGLNSPVYTGAVNCIAQGNAAAIWVEANPR